MIYTTHQELDRYRGASQNLDTAIDFIQSGKLDALELGKTPVDGDAVYAMRFDYTTIPQSEAFFEAHVKYADIHIILEGCESIGVTHVSQLTQTKYVEADDFIELTGTIRTLCPLCSGEALVVYPEDAHMVKLQTAEACAVRKAVVKVKL